MRILFSYGDEEYLPLICGYGHNLKEDNLCNGHLTTIETNDMKSQYKIEVSYKDKPVTIFLTYLHNYEVTSQYLLESGNGEPEILHLCTLKTPPKGAVEPSERCDADCTFTQRECNCVKNYLIDCHIIKDDNKIPVIDYRRYRSLQIGEYCYDDIHAFRISSNI